MAINWQEKEKHAFSPGPLAAADLNQVRIILCLFIFRCKTAFLEAMDSVGLDTCILANQESIQADLNAVVEEYFHWTGSA